MVTLHGLGGLTKFEAMAGWVSGLVKVLVQDAIGHEAATIDMFAAADNFLVNMITETDCLDLYITSHAQLRASLSTLVGKFLENQLTQKDSRRL